MMGYSKHGTNDLNKLYGMANITPLIENRKINILRQLLKNNQTSMYLMDMLTKSDCQYSIIPDILKICCRENINIIDLVLNKHKSFTVKLADETKLMDPNFVEKLKNLIANWNISKNRREMKETINRNINKY